jgi:cytochrome c556
MVEVARHWDSLVALQKRDWQSDPEHPDVDATSAAAKLADLLARADGLAEAKKGPEDFRDWLETSVEESAGLLQAVRAGEDAKASKAMRVLKQTCGSCHASYRNEERAAN